MATVNLTEEELQAVIHRRYEKNNSVPDSDSEDYLVRRSMMCDAVEKWGNFANAENIKWRELYTSLDDAATGDTTALANDTEYDAPDDFVEVSSLLEIEGATGSTYYTYVDPDEVLNETRVNSGGYWFYITGSPSTGYVIHINNPVAGTIHYSYYKTPTLFTATTSVSEMKRPYFVVYEVLAALFEEERPDLSNKYLQMAADLLKAMQIDNELVPDLHPFPMTSVKSKVNGITWGKS